MKQRRNPTLRMTHRPHAANAALGTAGEGVHTMKGRRFETLYPYTAMTDIGKRREINEDSVMAIPPLFAVADGLGGHNAGEVASALAVETLREHAPRKADLAALIRAVEAANKAVILAAEEGIGRSGMGCTMTAAMIDEHRAVIAQVGDSRAYLLREGHLSQLTQDHSVVSSLVRAGHITPEEARSHPQRSVITRALGSDENLVVDGYQLSLLRGDRLLLCSDGLTGMIDDAHIAEIMMQDVSTTEVTTTLIQEANYAGGADNISVVVIDIDADMYANETALQTEYRLVRATFLWALAVVVVFAAVFFGILNYASHRAHLHNTSAGNIAIYKGIPGTMFGMNLATLSEVTTIPVGALSASDQSILREENTYSSIEEARAVLKGMVERSSLPSEQRSSDK